MNNGLTTLLEFLENVVREEDVIKHPYEVCIDCREVLEHGAGISTHEGHTLVLQDCDHSGVSEWINCLRWVLKKGHGPLSKGRGMSQDTASP